MKPKSFKSTEAALAKARTRDSTQALSKLTTIVDGQHRILSDPPLIVPVEELFDDMHSHEIYDELQGLVRKYSRTLQSDRRHLLEQFTLVQAARKAVGVGSVGTRAGSCCWSLEAASSPCSSRPRKRSVGSRRLRRASKIANQGQRVVAGQHLMQATVTSSWVGNGSRAETEWTATTTSGSCGTGSSPCRLSG